MARFLDRFFSFPSPIDLWEGLQEFSPQGGLTVSEDNSHVYVEAALPGIKPEEVDLTFDTEVLWIQAEKTEEKEVKEKKFYKKAISSFSYRVAVPGNIDISKKPDAVYKNGILTVTFDKKKKESIQKEAIKKISVRQG